VKAVDAVLGLRTLLDDLDATISALENRVIQSDQSHHVVTQLERAREKRTSMVASLRRMSSALGITQRTNLTRVMNDKFARLRMNAYLLKQRIRNRLQERKFELRHREQSYRNAVNGTVVHLFSYSRY
jgi:hypothetical protein